MEKKIYIFVISTLFLFITFSVFFVCLAENVNNGEYLINKEHVTYATELAEVEETINIHYNNSTSILNELNCGTLQYESAYRFFTTSSDIISDYNEKGSFEKIISDNYVWKIPTSLGGLATVEKTDNNWKIMGAREPFEISTTRTLYEEIDKKAIIDIINNNEKLDNIIDFKFVVCYGYEMSFAYFKTDSNEFLIPFYNEQLDIKRLERGKLYTAEDVFVILTDNYNLESNVDEAINNVSVSVNENEDETLGTQEKSIIIVLSIAFLLIVSVCVILTVKQKKKKLNDKLAEDDKETTDCVKTQNNRHK